MDELIPWSDYVSNGLDPIIAINGTERMAGINSSSLSATVTPNAMKDFIAGKVLVHYKITLGPAQILNMASGIQIHPGVGPNAIMAVVGVAYRKRFVSTPYSGGIQASWGQNTLYVARQIIMLDFTQSMFGAWRAFGIEQESQFMTWGTAINMSTGGTPAVGGDGFLDLYFDYYKLPID